MTINNLKPEEEQNEPPMSKPKLSLIKWTWLQYGFWIHFFFSCARMKLKSKKENTHTHIHIYIYIYIYICNMLAILINIECRGLTSIYETKILLSLYIMFTLTKFNKSVFQEKINNNKQVYVY